MEKKSEISRRIFFKQAATAAVVAGAATTGILASSKKAEAHETPIPPKWDMETDVIVVGSGFAGMAAAVEAHDAGAKVILVEKMPVFGGNSAINGGIMAVAGLPHQEEAGIEDSPELMTSDMEISGRGMCDIEQTRIVSDNILDTFIWTRDYIGVKWNDKLLHLGGHSVPRCLQTRKGSGAGITKPLFKKAKALGVDLKKKVYVDKILQDEKGRVIGLQVKVNYKFGKENSGKTQFIKARKGVVMASGGFGADVVFRSSQAPTLTAAVEHTNQQGATAECLKEMLRLGANPMQLSWIQTGPWASPDEKGFGLTPIYTIIGSHPHGMMINGKTGERFVDELADRRTRAQAIIKTGVPSISICDDVALSKLKPTHVEKIIERGVVIKFENIEQLAQHYNLPVDTVKKQFDRYNKLVASGEDPDFGKPFELGQVPMEKGPLYGVRVWPKVHHCMGGVDIDSKCRVLDLDRKPIDGLYAAGEAAAGTHGASRLGACGIADALVHGRIAGKAVAKA